MGVETGVHADYLDLLAAGYTSAEWHTREGCVRQEQQERVRDRLNQFLSEVERSAFRMAEIAVRNPDDALDIVQDTMIKLVEKYAHKPESEWRPLFYSILRSKITDFHRRGTRTRKLFRWLSEDEQETELAAEAVNSGPAEEFARELTLERLISGLQQVSERQQQAFMLRTWQGFNVAETAKIMQCTQGSVKTHLSRATEALLRFVTETPDQEGS